MREGYSFERVTEEEKRSHDCHDLVHDQPLCDGRFHRLQNTVKGVTDGD